MHVAMFGAGVLGRVYGVRLAVAGAMDVAFVVRPRRVAETDAFLVERVGTDEQLRVQEPRRVAHVPAEADLVVVTVHADQVVEVAARLREESTAPVLCLTPLLPPDLAAARVHLGDRLIAGAAGVVGYQRGSAVRYWTFPFVPTRIEDSLRLPEPIRRFGAELSYAGLPVSFEKGVDEQNAALTVGFFPLMLALELAGGAAPLMEHRGLFSLAVGATRDTLRLSRRVGSLPPPLGLAAPLVHAPTVRAALHTLQRIQPELIRFLDEHFGEKLHAQHLRLAAQILELAREKEEPIPAFEELARRLQASPARDRPGEE